MVFWVFFFFFLVFLFLGFLKLWRSLLGHGLFVGGVVFVSDLLEFFLLVFFFFLALSRRVFCSCKAFSSRRFFSLVNLPSL